MRKSYLLEQIEWVLTSFHVFSWFVIARYIARAHVHTIRAHTYFSGLKFFDSRLDTISLNDSNFKFFTYVEFILLLNWNQMRVTLGYYDLNNFNFSEIEKQKHVLYENPIFWIKHKMTIILVFTEYNYFRCLLVLHSFANILSM